MSEKAIKSDAGTLTETIVTLMDQAHLGIGRFNGMSPTRIESMTVFIVNDEGQRSPLYEFEALFGNLKLVAGEPDEHEAIENVDRAGLYSIEIEFNPSTRSSARFDIRKDLISIKDESNEQIPIRLSVDAPNFDQWFGKLCALVDDRICIIPDTNFLRRQYYSHYFRPIVKKYPDKISFALSRLSILEIENKYNREAGRSKNKAKTQTQAVARRERRLGLHTLKEISQMKHDDIEVLPPVDTSSIKSFLDNAEYLADAWIRYEILRHIESRRKNTILINTGDKPVRTQYMFATADKMNALAASAENISTFYVARPDNVCEVRVAAATGPHVYKFATLLVNTAITFGKCEVEISLLGSKTSNTTIKVTGEWANKTINDWLNERVLVEVI